jgi:integrase
VSAKPLQSFFGKIRLDEMSAAGIEKFKIRRLQDCSAAGVNRDLSALRFILNFGVQMGYLERNPFQGVKLLPEGPGMMRIVSPEEEKLYLEAAPTVLQDVATLILQTGMRPQEVFSIQKADVELVERYLFIPKGKTKYARRTIPLSDEALAVLRRRVEDAEGDWLFPHRVDENRPMPACRSHDTVVRKLGLDFRLYDLRHTFGSRAAMAGVDLPTLKELMGHSSITLTMRYVHPTPAHKKEAIEKLKNWEKRTPHKNPHRQVRGSRKTLK